MRLSPVSIAYLNACDSMTALAAEYAANQYGQGGANALTDEVVASSFPAATAAGVFFMMGLYGNAGAILDAAAQERQGLEVLRP